MKLLNEVKTLIDMHQEGPYWDFKREWYSDNKDGEMLIDIICMANNLVDRDAYIIIGVDEENDFAIQDVSQDSNRRNTQNLTDFIRGKKFAGDFRPVVTVEALHLDEGVVDVIVVHNSTNTPYYLKEMYKGLFPNNIYVRLRDSNTPINKSADYHHVEYLWKKRLGMLYSPLEKVELYLRYPEDWLDSPSNEDKKYYKYAPEYTIEHTHEPEDGRDGYEYYLFAQTDSRPHWCEIRICFHQTVLAELGGVILDGGRYFTATPDRDGISLTELQRWDVPYRYMVKGNLNYLIHEFYYVDDGDEARHAHNKYEECILIFENEEEHQEFRNYVAKNWHRKDEFSNNINIPYMEHLSGYNMDAFREEYKTMQILRKMLEEFRIKRSRTIKSLYQKNRSELNSVNKEEAERKAKEIIIEELKRIEDENDIEILLAVESGSRAWGFASPDSDYDVRFIYKCREEDYLRLDQRRDVSELPIDEVLDINGWDISKALQLLHKSNPTLFEWFSSPIRYIDTDFRKRFDEIKDKYFISKSGVYHYLSMAKGNFREYLKKDMVRAKKYFYVIRPILACKWILEKQTPPPMLFADLVESQLEEEMKPIVEHLLDLKMNSPEVKEIPRIDALNEYIEKNLTELEDKVQTLPYEKNSSWEELNSFFLNEITKLAL